MKKKDVKGKKIQKKKNENKGSSSSMQAIKKL